MSGPNCSGCPLSHGCCGRGPVCQPYLLPHEVSKYNSSDIERVVEKPEVYRLKRKEDGGCVFYDIKTKRCTNYENRPIECKLYPWIYTKDQDNVGIKLHDACYDRDKTNIPFFNSEMFDAPKEWWNAYFSIPWDL